MDKKAGVSLLLKFIIGLLFGAAILIKPYYIIFPVGIGLYILLKTKSRPLGFIKRFVVIYAEPDNSDQVKQFLEEHIPFEKLGVYTIEGLTIMEFQ